MNKKTDLRKWVPMALVGCVIVLAGWNLFGLGADHPNDRPASNEHWPKGMEHLVNAANRVHGFFVNDVDVFFFSGSATNFAAFLQEYSKIQGMVETHRLIVHEGVGEAKAPWEKTGRPCDWELYGLANGFRAGEITNYVLEVHFWTGGHIALDQVAIPQNVEVRKYK